MRRGVGASRIWFNEVWRYWCETVEDDPELASVREDETRRASLLLSGKLNGLPDMADRALSSDALAYRWDLFCTRDWTTVLKHR